MTEGGGPERRIEIGKKPDLLILFLCLVVLISLDSCRPSPPNTISPAEINNLEGQASFFIRSPERQGRLRLGFLFSLPDKVRLELSNPFGGLESLIWLNGPEATLYLAREKVFWRGDSLVITTDVFGQQLKPEELIRIFAARWSELELENGWSLSRDEKGQIIAGEKGAFKFAIKEYFAFSVFPRTVYFDYQGYSVRVRLKKLGFNRSGQENLFNPKLPTGSREKSWEEISGLWKK